MKYDLPGNQAEVLPNILNLTSKEEVGLSEFEGFLRTEIILSEQLTSRTKFNSNYILKIHRLSLQHLYSFAGKLRDVNFTIYVKAIQKSAEKDYRLMIKFIGSIFPG
ncbi:hypothetical protein [Mucilaginibacter flavidus]|uniref:hypothetical protein n=1 Tax=Mucilaginibacter flavidus TaxID=2949309 RepID=UPI002093EAD7|nr:hypothetical protein [Mucilaginibacter flavidus]MCO5948107.1 hypothetical protein [Mucilaginibacter flavidus]